MPTIIHFYGNYFHLFSNNSLIKKAYPNEMLLSLACSSSYVYHRFVVGFYYNYYVYVLPLPFFQCQTFQMTDKFMSRNDTIS